MIVNLGCMLKSHGGAWVPPPSDCHLIGHGIQSFRSSPGSFSKEAKIEDHSSGWVAYSDLISYYFFPINTLSHTSPLAIIQTHQWCSCFNSFFVPGTLLPKISSVLISLPFQVLALNHFITETFYDHRISTCKVLRQPHHFPITNPALFFLCHRYPSKICN